MGPLDLLVFQGTPFCNIDCKYCYLPNRSDKTRMTMDVVEKTIDRLLEADLIKTHFTVLWHAGEPLVMPISFYEEAFMTIRKKVPSHIQLVQNIQTNLTLLTQEWCDFIIRRNVDLGISLDGPEFLHNRNRVHRNGKGTFSEVMRGIELLKKNNIPLRILCVISKESAMYPEEIFDFFHQLGTSWIGFNIDEIEADNTTSSYSDDSECSEIMYNFFSVLLRKYKETGRPFVIREIRDPQQRIKYAPIKNLEEVRPMSHLLTPFELITVGTSGDYSTFCPEMLNAPVSNRYGNMILGNIFENAFAEAAQTEKFLLINTDIQAGIDMCKNNCDYYGLCQGGAPGNKLGEKGTFAVDETMHCRFTRKIPLDVVLSDALEAIHELQYQSEQS